MLEKAVKIKRFEYSPLAGQLKKHTNIEKKQHQTLDEVFESNKKEDDRKADKKPAFKKYNK